MGGEVALEVERGGGCGDMEKEQQEYEARPVAPEVKWVEQVKKVKWANPLPEKFGQPEEILTDCITRWNGEARRECEGDHVEI